MLLFVCMVWCAWLSIDSDDNTTSSLTTDGKLQRVSAKECNEVSFTVKSKANMEVLILNVGESFLDGEKVLELNVLFELCPNGFPLDQDNASCVCDKQISNFLQSCEITDDIRRKLNFKAIGGHQQINLIIKEQ